MMKAIYLTTIMILAFSLQLKVQAQNTAQKKVVAQFKDDLFRINKVYHNISDAEISYTYRIYADSAKTRVLRSFPAVVVKHQHKTYYKYAGTEILHDSAFTLIVSHDEKEVTLLRKQEHALSAGIGSLIDTALLANMLQKTTGISFQKKNRVSTYHIRFNEEASLLSMIISFDDTGMIRELSTCNHPATASRQEDKDPQTPVAITITRNSFSDKIKDPSSLNTSTYFKLFGNGRYVLSDLYQTYTLNNLYEKQDF